MRRAFLGLGSLALLGACFSPDTSLDVDTESSSSGTSGSDSQTSSATTETTTTNSGTDSTTDPTNPTVSTTAGPTTTDSGSSGDTTTGGVVQLECVEEILSPALGSPVASASTLASGDDFTGSCGGTSTNDVAYQWIAPFSDYFVFDTQGSDYDTSLYLLAEACDGEEVVCNDNAPMSAYSRIVQPFEEGDQVVVVVDGVAGEDGDAILNINAVDCPSADLTDQSLPATFSNVAGTNQFSTACGGDGNVERAFRYTAPQDGLYSFRATSQDFSPIVEVQTGPECGGEVLQCNSSGGTVGSEVIRNLDQGDTVTIIVDSAGGTGDFEINVTDIGLTCPQNLLNGNVTGDLDDFDHRMTASCGPAGEVISQSVNFFNATTYSWTSPGQVGTSSGCNIIYEGGFPAAITLQQGGECAGAELQCDSGGINMAGDGYTGMVSVGHIPATEFTITVTQIQENLVPIFGSNFEIRIECFAIA